VQWRRLHNKEVICSVFIIKYYSGDKIKNNEMGRTIRTYGERRGAYSVLVGKPGGGRPLGRSSRRSEDNFKTDLREVGWESVDWIDVTQDRDRWRVVVNAVTNLRVP
jgi:hypothetical protein